MDQQSAFTLLQTLIDFFAAGNNETDRTAKIIIEWDFDNLARWQAEITNLLKNGEWTGIRSPEAEILTLALRKIQNCCETQQ